MSLRESKEILNEYNVTKKANLFTDSPSCKRLIAH
jgi:hypothetical protein